MSVNTRFVIGTIVQAEYLNSDQEVDTGLTWGLNLQQGTTAGTLGSGVAGTDGRSSLIIGGQRTWRDATGVTVAGSGTTGTKSIWATTYVADPPTSNIPPGANTLPDFNLEILDNTAVPEAQYQRKIGTGNWNGTEFNQVRLTNGVQADAYQFNSFLLKTVTDSDQSNSILTLSAWINQDSDTNLLLQVGVDGTTDPTIRYGVTSTGISTYTPDTISNVILRTNIQTGTSPDYFITRGTGAMEWGSGALVTDTFMQRTAPATLQIINTLDTVYLQNSTANGGGYVNVNNDLNLAAGKILRYNGVPFGSDELADAADIVHIDRTETITGNKTFSGTTTFTGETDFNADNNYIQLDTNGRSRIASRAFVTFMA